MDLRPKSSAVVFCLLVIFILSKSSDGQNLCEVDVPIIFFKENNTIGDTVTTITAETDVTVNIINEQPADLFSLDGFNLIAIIVLDYEAFNKDVPYVVDIECTKPGSSSTILNLKIIIENINDNPPVFASSEFTLDINELLKVDTSVERITATDVDEGDQPYYRLDSAEGYFGLEAALDPNILVKKILDYDKVKQVTMTLYAQDTPLSSTAPVSHTASTTITVNILDMDNRPPWFQPCTEIQIDTSTVCVNSGYTGTVNLTEQATGPLSLTPGPVRAIDGDKGINEAIGYTFLGGNEDGTFEINSDTGDITMAKPVDVAGPIILTVMAFQKQNSHQYATNMVTFRVVLSTKHPPKFTQTSYEGFISEDAGVDSLVLESQTSNKPLRVQATDEDYANGVNPDIIFEVIGGNDFYITSEGFILMAKAVSPGTVNLQMRVVDTNNGESSTASLTVEVTPGIPTTTAITTIMTSEQTTEQTTLQTTAQTTVQTTDHTTDQTTVHTTDHTTDQTTVHTTDHTTDHTTVQTTDQTTGTQQTDSTTTSHTSDTHTTLGHTTGEQQLRVEGYRAEDMAAVGASLAVVIILCLVGIGLLAYRVKRHNSDWKKLSEASVFRSNLGGGSGGPKEGVQYTNQGFQHDDDSGSVSSGLAADLEMKLESEVKPAQKQTLNTVSVPQTSSSRSSSDSSSLAGADVEKEVKPILTKERRAEEGYKAVWFKQDIDPNTKEEVVIIPETGEPADHDDDEDDEEDDDEGEHQKTDMDEETEGRYSRESDSEDEEGLTSDL